MAFVVEDDPEQLNPVWQLPAYIEQVQRLHLDHFTNYCRRAQAALDRMGEEPNCPYHDETNAQLALRYLRLALANFDPPVTGLGLRQIRREKILNLFGRCQEPVASFSAVGAKSSSTSQISVVTSRLPQFSPR